MITNFVHRLVANPRVYDAVQHWVGAESVQQRIGVQARKISSTGIVLDLGGGTGLARRHWPAESTYICLDVDPAKLQAFARRRAGGNALLADATRIPIRTGSVDVVVCVNVTHHLNDQLFDILIAESHRVLKNSGEVLFVDAVWAPSRWKGRLLWKYDRGSHPRPVEAIDAALTQHFDCLGQEHVAVIHEYVLWMGRRR
jgi:SAM-dependent methyltransferase